jgi:hypothetical protein
MFAMQHLLAPHRLMQCALSARLEAAYRPPTPKSVHVCMSFQILQLLSDNAHKGVYVSLRYYDLGVEATL